MNIQVIKSRRRTIGIEVHADGKVIVRTPLRMSSTEINRFIDEHEDWIRQKLDFVRQKSDNRHGTGAPGIECLSNQEKLDREAEESKNVYRGNAIFGGAISQNGSSQTGSDANRSTSQTAAAGNVGESTNANSAAQAGGMAVSSTGKAYYNPGKERSKIQKKVKKAEEDLAVKEAKLDELKAELMKPEYQSSYSKLTEIQNEIDALEEEILIDMEAWEELSSQLEALG